MNPHSTLKPRFRERFIFPWSLTDGDQYAGDARDAAGDHGEEEDPPAAPLVHGVPAHEIGRHLNKHYFIIIIILVLFYEAGGHLDGCRDEEAQVRVHVQVGRVERQPVVHDGVHQPGSGGSTLWALLRVLHQLPSSELSAVKGAPGTWSSLFFMLVH